MGISRDLTPKMQFSAYSGDCVFQSSTDFDIMCLQIVQAIGAAEDNVLDFGAPKRIDGTAAINLIDAAVETAADQYVMISSLGTGKFGWPAGIPLHCTAPKALPACFLALKSSVPFKTSSEAHTPSEPFFT